MQIRRLTPADAPAYRVLRLRALREHPQAFTSSFEEEQDKALVIGMYVASEHTRQGLARALLDALLADARSDGVALLVLTVTRGNVGAERLYLDAGFASFGVEPGAIKVQNQYFDKNHMFLQLAAS